MRLKECKEGLPRRQNNKLEDILKEFMHMNVPVAIAELDVGEYASPRVAQNVLGIAARRNALPVKSVCKIGKVYLVRTDM